MPPSRKPKKWIAKCSQNQAALDRLVEHRETKDLKDRYSMTLKRGMESLMATTDPVATYEQAKALKHVGDHIASLICPPQKRSTPSPASSAASSTTSHVQNRKAVATKRNLHLATIPEGGKKQKMYDHITEVSERNWKNAKCWRVILLIDERERESRRMASACEMSGIPCEVRTMPIGDMGWIAQGLDAKGNVVSELVLGTLVERKTPEDLKSSLFGTRYQEQRLRLKNSGVPQILFLIEGELRDLSRCPLDTLLSAVWETRLHTDFQIVQTEDLTGTVRLLKRIHRRILQRTFPQAFSGSMPLPIFMEAASSQQAPVRGQRRVQSLAEMTFDSQPVPCFGMERFITYMELKAKVERDREAGTRTVRNIHLAMLKQVPTFSNVKCEAIARIYPTPRSLLSANLSVAEIAKIPTKNPKESQKIATIGEKSAKELILVYGNSFQMAPNPFREPPVTQHAAKDVVPEQPSLQPPPAKVNYFSKQKTSLIEKASRNSSTEDKSSSVSALISERQQATNRTLSTRELSPISPIIEEPGQMTLPHGDDLCTKRSTKQHTCSTSLVELESGTTIGYATLRQRDSGDESFPSPAFGCSTSEHYGLLSSPEEESLHVAMAQSKQEMSPEERDFELAIQLSLQDQQQNHTKKQRRLLNTSLGSLLDDSSDDELRTTAGRKPAARTTPHEVIEID